MTDEAVTLSYFDEQTLRDLRLGRSDRVSPHDAERLARALDEIQASLRASRAAATTGDPAPAAVIEAAWDLIDRRNLDGSLTVVAKHVAPLVDALRVLAASPPPGSAAPDDASERLARCHHDDHTLPSLPAGSAAREDGAPAATTKKRGPLCDEGRCRNLGPCACDDETPTPGKDGVKRAPAPGAAPATDPNSSNEEG